MSNLHIYTFVVLRAFIAGAASQAGDADSFRAHGLISALQGSENVQHDALLLVPQCISSFVFYSKRKPISQNLKTTTCLLPYHNFFPFLSNKIPSSPAYGVFISQLIRYARACSSYECFILRAMQLSPKLHGQGYVMERLKSSLRKFYGRYGDLIKQSPSPKCYMTF